MRRVDLQYLQSPLLIGQACSQGGEGGEGGGGRGEGEREGGEEAKLQGEGREGAG